jgi:anti-anti-sigma factor
MTGTALHPLLELDRVGSVVIVRFLGQPDGSDTAAEELGAALFRVAQEVGGRAVLLDLEAVAVLSSGLIGKLLTFRRKVHAAGGQVALCGVNHALREKLTTNLRLGLLFAFYDTQSQALKAL